MIITRQSMFTGEIHSRELDVTPGEMENFKNGMLIQHAFPRLSSADREFILTGTTEEEWDAMLPKEDQADEDDLPF